MRVANFRRSCVRAAAPVVAFLQTLAREVFVALNNSCFLNIRTRVRKKKNS
jgi:hypothetical protein